MNASLVKEQVSMAGLLARLGFEPARRFGQELVYFSMLRDRERTPSFSVNDSLQVWFDHGTGKGGNVIDFGLAYWPNLNFKGVVQKLWEVSQQAIPAVPRRQRRALKLPHYQVEKVVAISEGIAHYLANRGLRKEHLKEVHYRVIDEKGVMKHFFAAGHQNELGGWEVRNKYFKGCLGKKALTIVIGDPRRVALFEGYFDYLSWLHDHPDNSSSVIVLNSLSLLEAAQKVAMRYPEIDLYFDFDKPGRIATRTFMAALPYATDRSSVFEGHHDYNDKRKSEARAEREAGKPKDFFEGLEVPFSR